MDNAAQSITGLCYPISQNQSHEITQSNATNNAEVFHQESIQSQNYLNLDTHTKSEYFPPNYDQYQQAAYYNIPGGDMLQLEYFHTPYQHTPLNDAYNQQKSFDPLCYTDFLKNK